MRDYDAEKPEETRSREDTDRARQEQTRSSEDCGWTPSICGSSSSVECVGPVCNRPDQVSGSTPDYCNYDKKSYWQVG